MTVKKPKLAYRILVAVMVLTLTAVACNNKKDEKKTEETVKPADDANKMDTTGMDTGTTRPVKTPD